MPVVARVMLGHMSALAAASRALTQITHERGGYARERRGPPERLRRIGLAAGQFEIVRRRPIALEENAQPAGAIDDSNRCLDAAFGQGRFSNRQGHAKRNVALHQHLRAPRGRNHKEYGKRDCGSQSKRHENLHCCGMCSIPSAQARAAAAADRATIPRPSHEPTESDISTIQLSLADQKAGGACTAV